MNRELQPGKTVQKNDKFFICLINKNPSCVKRDFEEGKKSSSNFRYKFWEHENHPVLLDSTEMYNQRLNYLHWNPVTAGFVGEPWHWIYSSAIDYFTDKKGLLDLIILEGF